MSDLERRIRRLEDRAAISECVVAYAYSLDRLDWDLFLECIHDPIHIDFSDWSGMEPRDWRAAEWKDFAALHLTGFAARHHVSPNHRIAFAADDAATCLSYMFAQHHMPGAEGGEDFLMRGSYTNELVRVDGRWRIRSMTQHFQWGTGNPGVFEAAKAAYVPA